MESGLLGVVLVHGFKSGPQTWRLLEKRIEEDRSLAFVRVLPFQYATGIRRWHPLRVFPDIDTVADSLKEYLRTEAGPFEHLMLVTHSMGGLVVQRYMARMLADGNGRELARVRRVVMLACPNDGSELMLLLRRRVLGGGHPQELALRPLNGQVAETRRTINRDVLHAAAVSDRTCPVAFSVYAGDSDRVVSPVSARSVFPDAAALPGDHFTILKTTTPEHRTFTTLRRLLHETAADSGPASGAHRVDSPVVPPARRSGIQSGTASGVVADRAVWAVQEPPAEPTGRPSPRSASRGGPALLDDCGLRERLEQFADVARRQIEDETSRDKAADPIPMPVRWSITERYPADRPVNVWGEGGGAPASLEAGTFDTLAELFSSIPTGRLVVLGKGGAGKTVLVRELARTLLKDLGGTVVPVVFRLSSWNPDETTLRKWTTTRLTEDYPLLREQVRDRREALRSTAAVLVDERRVLPILDGLDEVAPPLRTEALRQVNAALRSGDHLVLTSRPTEYAEAVGAGRGLALAAVVELHDLTPDDLRAYLPRTTRLMDPEQPDRTKWDRVLGQLDRPGTTGASVLSEVLATPLMASLARAVYSETRADPAELLDVGLFPDAEAITDRLLDAFVDVTYDDGPPDPASRKGPRWRPDDARRWLGFLAVMMSAQETYEFAWWKPGQRRSMRLFNWPANGLMILAGALAVGLETWWGLRATGGSAGRPDTTGSALVLAALGVFVISQAIWLGAGVEPRELSRPSWWWVRKYKGISLRDWWEVLPLRESVLFCATVMSSLFILDLSLDGRFPVLLLPRTTGSDPAFPVAFMAAFVGAMVSFYGFIAVMTPGRIDARTPTLVLHNDRRAALATGLYYGGTLSVLCGPAWVLSDHSGWLVATPGLFVFSLVIAFCLSSYGTWLIRRTGFALARWLPPPWRCMTFLDDACRRGVLRQTGGTYRFRHALLQERLAAEFLAHRDPWVARHRTISYVHAYLSLTRLAARDDVDGMASELRAVIERHRRLRQGSYTVVSSWSRLIDVLRRDGRREEALSEAMAFRQFVDGIGTRGARRYWHYRSRRVLADSLADVGRLAEAIAAYAETLALAEDYWGQDDEDAAKVRSILNALREPIG